MLAVFVKDQEASSGGENRRYAAHGRPVSAAASMSMTSIPADAHDVARLDVSVDEPLRVQVLQRERQFLEHGTLSTPCPANRSSTVIMLQSARA